MTQQAFDGRDPEGEMEAKAARYEGVRETERGVRLRKVNVRDEAIKPKNEKSF